MTKTNTKNLAARIAKIARDQFGFRTFLPGQKEAIESVLSGHDTLVVKPTGSGKSAIYQIATALLPGPAIVVSPLIALQKDQVDSIAEAEAGEAAVVNSTLRVSEAKEAFEKLDEGRLDFLFLAPEQFHNPEMLQRVKDAKPSLFVVDEAHCISEWGHDFRPDYLKLGGVVEELGHPVVLALTATAAPRVREEIVERLGMKKPRVIVRGFDRPNIWLGVRYAESEAAKRDALLDAVEEAEKPGIVYTATRRHAEEIAKALEERGVRVAWYHGGMKAAERAQIQEEFMGGDAGVIVATSAFGMGVDKPNVRFVFHYDISDSIDSYYQEIGRGGRDGNPARALLFYRPEDLALQNFFKGGGKLEEEKLKQVAETVIEEDGPVDAEELKDKVGVSDRKLTKALNRLQEAGAVEVLPDGEVVAATEPEKIDEAVHEAAKAQQEYKEYEHLRVEKMRMYAELRDCRREYLLNYFGEDVSGPCGNCDRCQAQEKTAAPEPKPRTQRVSTKRAPEQQAGPFPLKTRVVHSEWGKGVVENYEGDKIIVLFDDVGRKTLSLAAVLENKLLDRAA
ncbi:MAG TPA: ATP-dependent DNA helicase RecQ [Bryobacteraceae bacterium]|nr:ATP-dependent DNA helicase RecQ [Bryobacteraceae bacterium]